MFYVSIGMAVITLIGGPLYIRHMLMIDPETRYFFEEHYPEFFSTAVSLLGAHETLPEEEFYGPRVDKFADRTDCTVAVCAMLQR